WTHFFRADRAGGRALLEDFHAVHGAAEDYGPIPAALVDRSDPARLAALVDNNGFADQPNPFPAAAIEHEVEASSPGQPFANLPPGRSPSWDRRFDAAYAGASIPPPYHDAKVYDAGRLVWAADLYRRAAAGAVRAPDLPDLRDVFLDDALGDLGVRPIPGAS